MDPAGAVASAVKAPVAVSRKPNWVPVDSPTTSNSPKGSSLHIGGTPTEGTVDMVTRGGIVGVAFGLPLTTVTPVRPL